MSQPRPILPEFDIIFAGGGATACVAAGRLAAYDSSLKILILEAGGHTLDQAAHVQPYQYVFHLAPTSTTVTVNVGNPSPHLNGRAPIVHCGRCVGGGSSVNFMAYTRAAASDFDDWEADGWESENLIPLMKKLETYEVQPNGPTHGDNGPIRVSYGGRESGLWEEFIHVETCNVYSPWAKYINGTTGRRSDAAHHYVYNQAHNQNLQLWVSKLVKRIIFEGMRAVGVEFTCDPVSCPGADQSSSIVRAAKLVVVSAGAFGSPTILERSGIGAEAVLKRCGIEQLVNLPGVGENYQDHLGCFAPYFAADEAVTLDPLWHGEGVVQESLAQWKSNGKSLIAQNGCDAKIKWRPDEDELRAMGSAFQAPWKEFFQDRPDKAVALFGLSAGYLPLSSTLPFRKYLGVVYFTLYPRSLGSVHVKLGENGKQVLDFTAGFLDDPSDIVPLNFGYKKTREISRRMPSYRGEVPSGHPCFPEGSAAACSETSGPVNLNAPDIIYTTEDDEAIEKFHRDCTQTSWHSLGTCAMKPMLEKGVVDARLNVYGVAGLKVADMSIAPKNVGTNTYSTALLIGEKAALIIAEDLGMNCREYTKG
ncbi:GMC oxidoreductase-domain-containing protein [Suillus bovinus]|uniref:GMC oxidoreductase-domain-containing protein n=1 Tax=Suillus bovinus TaxID=48563 RepID=UPI001B87284A|nr:GMC oxidoreductase-domain-containing protein [Suillus bovinus]KAG2128374.1 GMC oxidoreductase-domain-containing protein [Suillus bovinus]